MNKNDQRLRLLLLEAQAHEIGVVIETDRPDYCYTRFMAIRKALNLTPVLAITRVGDDIWIIKRAKEINPASGEEDS